MVSNENDPIQAALLARMNAGGLRSIISSEDGKK